MYGVFAYAQKLLRGCDKHLSQGQNASTGTVWKRKVLNKTSNFHVVAGTYKSRQVAKNVHDVMKYRLGRSASIEQIL